MVWVLIGLLVSVLCSYRLLISVVRLLVVLCVFVCGNVFVNLVYRFE